MKNQSLIQPGHLSVLLLLALLLPLLVGCAAQPASPQPAPLPADPTITPQPAADVSLGEADAGKTIHLQKGQTLAIFLPGNPSTGYMWVVAPDAAAILSQVGEPEAFPQGNMPGAPAQIRLVLRAEADGSQQLKLEYRRPWEKDTLPERIFGLTVVVGAETARPTLAPTPAAAPVSFPAGGMKGWQTYTNADYGFSLQYPPEWTLKEGKGTMAGHAVLLLAPSGAAQLQVAFKHTAEDARIGRTGMGSGELVLSGQVLLVGAAVDRQVLVDRGVDMTVRYICSGCMTRGEMEFGFDLDALSGAGLPAEVEAQADLVVASLQLARP